MSEHRPSFSQSPCFTCRQTGHLVQPVTSMIPPVSRATLPQSQLWKSCRQTPRTSPFRFPESRLSTVEIILARQDLLKRPLNPIDFFADYSDRLLVFRRVGQRSDSFQSAAYLMIPSPNEVQPCAPLLAISVNAADELSGDP